MMINCCYYFLMIHYALSMETLLRPLPSKSCTHFVDVYLSIHHLRDFPRLLELPLPFCHLIDTFAMIDSFSHCNIIDTQADKLSLSVLIM